MSNAMKNKATSITFLNGEHHDIKFDLNGLVELEDVYGDVDKAFADMEAGKIKAVRAVLWAGLLHEDPDRTIKDVGAMFTLEELEHVVQTIGKALDNDMVSSEEVNPN